MIIVLPESFSSSQDLLPAMKALGISPNEQEVIIGISDFSEILSYDCDNQLVVYKYTNTNIKIYLVFPS